MKAKIITKMNDKFKWFTLVELIVVIAILIILGTIAFTSLTGFQSSARDGDRVTTLKNIDSGLSLFQLKTGSYPMPEANSSWVVLTGSINGTIYAYMGVIGDLNTRNIKMNKIPTDPLSNTSYVYGVSGDKKYYQVATVLENTEAYNLSPIFSTVYADSSYQAKVNGNYPGYLKFTDSSGSIWIANTPSLLWNNTGSVNLLSTGTYFVVNKQANLPYKLDTGTVIQNKDADKMVQAITGTGVATLTGVNITGITAETLTGTFTPEVLANFGWDIAKMETIVLGTASTSAGTAVSNNCDIQPTYTNASFTIWTPTQANQPWQGTTSTWACYWTCGSGKTLVWNDCVSENCSWTDPNTINATANATTTAWWTWNYNPGWWLCSFDCNPNYDWNGTTACTDQTPPTGWDFTMPTTTNTTSVVLTITCPTDVAGSTPIQMYISWAWLATWWWVWESCVSSKNITLTTWDGNKAITLKWKDGVGNESGVMSKSVGLSSTIKPWDTSTVVLKYWMKVKCEHWNWNVCDEPIIYLVESPVWNTWTLSSPQWFNWSNCSPSYTKVWCDIATNWWTEISCTSGNWNSWVDARYTAWQQPPTWTATSYGEWWINWPNNNWHAFAVSNMNTYINKVECSW